MTRNDAAYRNSEQIADPRAIDRDALRGLAEKLAETCGSWWDRENRIERELKEYVTLKAQCEQLVAEWQHKSNAMPEFQYPFDLCADELGRAIRGGRSRW